MPKTQDFKKASASAQDISGNFKMYPCMYYLHVCPCMCAIWSPPQAPSIFVVGRCGLCKFNTWRILLSSLLSLSLSPSPSPRVQPRASAQHAMTRHQKEQLDKIYKCSPVFTWSTSDVSTCTSYVFKCTRWKLYTRVYFKIQIHLICHPRIFAESNSLASQHSTEPQLSTSHCPIPTWLHQHTNHYAWAENLEHQWKATMSWCREQI